MTPDEKRAKVAANARRRYARMKADPARHAAFLEKARQRPKSPEKVREWKQRAMEKLRASPTAVAHVKQKQRARVLRLRYGLTEQAYRQMLISQNSRCAVCRRAEAGGKKAWHIDHDHQTGRVRGILCHWCNTALGQMGDSPETLRRAASYLETHGRG